MKRCLLTLVPDFAFILQNEFVPKLATKIQNFFRTCPKTYRLSALYLIDSICKSKGDSRKSYIEAFSQPLPGLLSVFLKDGDDKDEVRFRTSAAILPLPLCLNYFYASPSCLTCPQYPVTLHSGTQTGGRKEIRSHLGRKAPLPRSSAIIDRIRLLY